MRQFARVRPRSLGLEEQELQTEERFEPATDSAGVLYVLSVLDVFQLDWGKLLEIATLSMRHL